MVSDDKKISLRGGCTGLSIFPFSPGKFKIKPTKFWQIKEIYQGHIHGVLQRPVLKLKKISAAYKCIFPESNLAAVTVAKENIGEMFKACYGR